MIANKPLREQRAGVIDALDRILGDVAPKEDRILALRDIERTAKRMADGLASRVLTEWMEIRKSADRILHDGIDMHAEVVDLKARLAALPEDGSA